MDFYFHARQVKFDVLHKLIGPIIRTHQIQNVNVFINLDDILHKLHNPQIDKDLTVSKSNTIVRLTSDIINLAAHYREYMMREGWNTKVYLFYTSSTKGPFRNTVYRHSYRDHFININANTNQNYAHLNMAIPGVLSLTKSIVQYIEGVYLIDSSFIEPSVAPMILNSLYPADFNFIVTRDEYDYQYVIYPGWAIIYADSDEDKSALITSYNLWNFIATKEKIDKEKFSLNYQASLYPFALSIIGNKYRGIPKIRKCGWVTVLKVIDDLSKEPSGISSVSLREKAVDKLRGKSKVTMEDINANLACTDIYMQFTRFHVESNPSIQADFSTQMIDIPDYENLLTVDRIYFKDYHLNIPFLTKQMPNSVYFGKKFYLDSNKRGYRK